MNVWIIKVEPTENGTRWRLVFDERKRLITFDTQGEANAYARLHFDNYEVCEMELRPVTHTAHRNEGLWF